MITGAVGVYLLEVSVLLILLYIFNKLFLSGETLHRFNRFVWLTIIVVSFAVPRHIPSWLTFEEDATTAEMATPMVEMGEATMEVVASEGTPFFTFEGVVRCLLWLYIAGAVALLVHNIFIYCSLLRFLLNSRYNIKRQNRPEDNELLALFEECEAQIGLRHGLIRYVVHDGDTAPFSWFGFVAISRKDLAHSGREILLHELSHARQCHSLDIVLINLTTALLWFNPAAWLTKQALQQVHEYCADEAVLCSGVNAKEYQLLLIRKAVGSRLYSVSNSLNHSNLKKRITMMLKKKSSGIVAAKSFYAIPVIFCAMALFASPALAKYRSAVTEVKVTNNLLDDQIEEDIWQEKTIEKQALLFYVDGVEAEKSIATNIDAENIASISIVKSGNAEKWDNHKAWEDHNKDDYQGVIEIKLKEAEPNKKTYILDGKKITEEEYKALDLSKLKSVDVVKGSSSYDKYQDGDRSHTLVVLEDLPEQTPPQDKPFLMAEKMPVFQEDGDLVAFRNWVSTQVKYPAEAAKNRIQGMVLVSFVVDTDGSITDVEEMRSPNAQLTEEAIRVVKSSSGMWQPGEQRGQKVKVKYTLPVIFKLDK